MLRTSTDYPQSIIISNTKMKMEIYVHKFFPCVQVKLREILFIMQYEDDTGNLIRICKQLISWMKEDLDFYQWNGYKKDAAQLERNIATVERFIGK